MSVISFILTNAKTVTPTDPAGSCWLWQGPLDHGLPSIWFEGVRYRVHDELYRQEFGTDSDFNFTGTHCGVCGCVNPLHDKRAPRPPRVVGIFDEPESDVKVVTKPKFR